ncbi:hypothetical protein EC900091_5357, partial [Escherichia coli 90.0091]
PVRLAGAE